MQYFSINPFLQNEAEIIWISAKSQQQMTSEYAIDVHPSSIWSTMMLWQAFWDLSRFKVVVFQMTSLVIFYVMEPIKTNFRFWCCCWKQEFDQFSSWFRLMLFAWCRYDPFILAAFPPPPIIDPCPFSSAAHLPGVPCPVPTLFLSITFPLTYVHCILSIHILCSNLPSYCANCS